MRNTRLTVRAARWSASHPWRALGLWLVFIAAAVALAGTVTTQQATDVEMGVGESGRATEMVHDAGLVPSADEQVLITAADGDLDRSEAEAAADDVADRMGGLAEVAEVGEATWSASGDALMLPLVLSGDPDDASDTVEPVQRVTDAVAAEHAELEVTQTGSASVNNGVMEVVNEDLADSTAMSLPITLLIMLLAFGALIAAAIPVLLALSAVIISFGLYALASYAVPDMGTVANMVMLIGMAVGVDYSLFFVKRQREERERGLGSVDAVEVAAQTAGHSIIVSGLAVVVSVSALFLVGSAIFAGLAAGAIMVVAVAMLGSLTVVPALVGKLGRWVDRPRIPLLWRLQRRFTPGAMSGRVLVPVLRHPKAVLALAFLVAGALAMPVFSLQLQESTPDQLPDGIAAVEGMDRLQEEFPSEGTSMSVVALATSAESADGVHNRLEQLGVDAVASGDFADEGVQVTESADGHTFELELRSVHPLGSDASIDAVETLRQDLAPASLDDADGVEWAIGGREADSIDFADQQAGALPFIVAFVFVFTMVMMGVTFRSLGVVAITLVLNAVSLAVSFGVLVLVFQHSWAESLLGFTSNGAVVTWIPLFMFVVLVGLAMDYHVLALSRIREGAQRGASPLTAISWGMRRTAGTIMMASLVMVSVFGLFARSGLPEMKQMGVGLAVAVLVDAVLVRIVMLPALLALFPGVVRAMAARGPRRGGSAGENGVDEAVAGEAQPEAQLEPA